MKTLKRTNILLLSLCTLATACVESVTMVSTEEMPVVVNCVLTRDSTQYLYLYQAKRLNESEYMSISNAKVIVSGSGHSYDFTWDGSRWKSDFVPEYDTEYALSVTLEDGKSIHSTTRFPERMSISMHPIYVDYRIAENARYYRIEGCKDEAFLWLTATEEYKDSVRHICTNHPGADNFNIVGGVWEDLPSSRVLLDEFKDSDWEVDWRDRRVWDSFIRACEGCPLHGDYLRIHHRLDQFNASSDPMIQIIHEEMTPFPGGFVLEVDEYFKSLLPYGGYISHPLRSYFVSKEYDTYLRNVAKVELHSDELASMYSTDTNYTNIQGAIGIFGSAYWWDYV